MKWIDFYRLRNASSARPTYIVLHSSFLTRKENCLLHIFFCLKIFQKALHKHYLWPGYILKQFWFNYYCQLESIEPNYFWRFDVFIHCQLIYCLQRVLQYVDSFMNFIEKTVIWFFVCLKLEKQFWEKFESVSSLDWNSELKFTSYIDERSTR